MSFNLPTFPDLNPTLVLGVNAWFNEYINATQADIDVCCGGTKFPAIGHFLAILQDQATAVGCAVTRFTRPDG